MVHYARFVIEAVFVHQSPRMNSHSPESHDPGPLAPAIDWVDARFGPIRGLRGSQHAPGWWIYCCEITRPLAAVFSDIEAEAYGASIDGSEALRKALGEAVERYIAYNSFANAELQMILAKDSPTAHLFPRCLPDEPCPAAFKELPADALLTHVPMERLVDGSRIWVPGAYVHLRFVPAEKEPAITHQVSTGIAFHGDVCSAIWHGLCEVAERDAIMSFWWNRTQIPRLTMDAQSVPGALADRLLKLKNANLTVHLFDMTTDFNVPSVFCLLEGSRRPYFAAGAACSADPYAACRKAIDEALMIGNPAAAQPDTSPVKSFDDYSWVQSFDDHKVLYANWQGAPALKFLLDSNSNEISLDDFAHRQWWRAPVNMADLRDLAKILESQDLTVLWSDITTDDAAHMGHCVRVTVPQMIPLSVQHSTRWLGCERLNRLSRDRKPTVSNFNSFPHPFA